MRIPLIIMVGLYSSLTMAGTTIVTDIPGAPVAAGLIHGVAALNAAPTPPAPAQQVATQEKPAEAPSKPSPKTALEQGVDPTIVESLKEYHGLKYSLPPTGNEHNQEMSESARQKGKKYYPPMYLGAVAYSPHLRSWLYNWKQILLLNQVDERRIDFEASRLTEYEFERWASKRIQANLQ